SQADAVQGDGAKENDERGKARNDAAGYAEGEKLGERNGFRFLKRRGGVISEGTYAGFLDAAFSERRKPVTMKRAVFVAVATVLAGPSAKHQKTCQHRNGETGDNAEPGIEMFWNDVF